MTLPQSHINQQRKTNEITRKINSRQFVRFQALLAGRAAIQAVHVLDERLDEVVHGLASSHNQLIQIDRSKSFGQLTAVRRCPGLAALEVRLHQFVKQLVLDAVPPQTFARFLAGQLEAVGGFLVLIFREKMDEDQHYF